VAWFTSAGGVGGVGGVGCLALGIRLFQILASRAGFVH
jgi:hypothetical protein